MEDGKEYPVPTRDDIVNQVPILKKKFLRYSEFADATIEDILSPEAMKNPKTVQANTFESYYLENTGGGKFKMIALPIETQFAPVQAFISGDFNHDGHEDVLVGGNFYSYRVEYGPFDASIGTLLLGDGKGGWQVCTKENMGIMLKGDVRDMKRIHDKRGTETILVSYNNDTPRAVGVTGNISNKTTLATVK